MSADFRINLQCAYELDPGREKNERLSRIISAEGDGSATMTDYTEDSSVERGSNPVRQEASGGLIIPDDLWDGRYIWGPSM
jgi:hypothetical protein